MSEEKKNGDNDELNDLLDNALHDFDKGKSGSKVEKAEATGGTDSAALEGGEAEFFAALIEHAKSVEDRMKSCLGDDASLPSFTKDPEQFLAGFKKIAEAAALTLSGTNTASDDEVFKVSDSISQALKGLQEGTANLEAPASENDITNMFGSLNLDINDTEDNSFLPIIEGMVQSALSAEILMPTIKDHLEKYPKYLKENESTLSAEDKERFQKQLELYKVIEAHLEAENPDDPPAVKRKKYREVLADMRKLQDYGQPPAEILAETGLSFGNLTPGSGIPGPQCPTM